MRPIAVILLACSVLALPVAAEASCHGSEDRTGRTAFGDGWNSPAEPCRETEQDDLYEPIDWNDDRPSSLRTLGISGMGGGAGLAGIGGTLVLTSLFLPDGSPAQKVAWYGGVGTAITGGALFVTGAVLALIDAAAAPAPTPDGRGGQLVVAFRF